MANGNGGNGGTGFEPVIIIVCGEATPYVFAPPGLVDPTEIATRLAAASKVPVVIIPPPSTTKKAG